MILFSFCLGCGRADGKRREPWDCEVVGLM
jgi:hypothetical protein